MGKKILIGLVALVAVILGAVVIAPSFIDWNARLPEITAQVKSATGRELTIDGKLEVRILPSPMLTARGVKLGNVEGGQSPHMATLDAVEVRVALAPLLSGEVQVERIRLVHPVITVEKLADGRTNLEFTSSSQPDAMPSRPASGTASDAGAGMGVRLDNFEIVDATFIYKDAQSGRDERLEEVNATLRAASLQGPFEARGDLRLKGVPLGFEASLGQIIAERTAPINAALTAPGGSEAQISGALLGLETNSPKFKGKIKATGDNLERLLNAVLGEGQAPQLLAQEFALGTALSASATDVALEDLELQLGANRLTGGVTLALGDAMQFDVQLKATRLDLDAVLAKSVKGGSSSASSSSLIAPQPPKNGAVGAGDTGFALPKNVNGSVNLVVDGVTYKGGLVSNLRLNAALADGEISLSQLALQMPGVTDAALFGFLRADKGQPRFEGTAELLTSDPKGLSDWLGVALPPGVAQRLKRVSYTSAVSADLGQVVLSDIRLTGDRSTITGGVTVALRARPSFGMDLTLDAINLDTYLNGNGNGHGTTAASEASSANPPASADSGEGLAALQAWAALSALNDFDANVKVRLGALTLKGERYKNLVLDALLYAGTLELHSLQLGDFAGAGAKMSGAFTGFGAIPEMTGVKVDATAKDAHALATRLGLEGVPAGLGKVTVKTEADGSLLKPRFSTQVGLAGGTFATRGQMSLLPVGFGYEGTVSAKHADAQRLIQALGVGYTPNGPLGALDLNTQLSTDFEVHKLTDIKAKIGDMPLSGRATIKTAGVKPNVHGDFTAGVIPVDRFMPREQKNAQLQRPANPLLIRASYGGADQVAQAGADVSKRWSRDPIDLSALSAFDGDVTLRAEAIQFETYRLDNADIHATLKNGVLVADRLQGNLFGGPVSGTAEVRADGRPTLKTDLTLNALDIRQAVKAVSGKDLAGGRLNLGLDFQATGLSAADLVSSLTGAGNLKIASLDVQKGGQGTALAGVIGLVAAMNQFSLQPGSGPGKGLADVGMSFAIQNGVAQANDLSIVSALGSGSGAGSVDLARWAIDFTGNMTVEANLLTTLLSKGQVGRQEVPFSVKGNLDKPGVNLGIRPAQTAPQGTQPTAKPVDPFRQMLERALPGAVPPKQQPQQQPAPQQPTQQQDGTVAPPPPQQGGGSAPAPSQELTPEQMIQNLMRGL